MRIDDIKEKYESHPDDLKRDINFLVSKIRNLESTIRIIRKNSNPRWIVPKDTIVDGKLLTIPKHYNPYFGAIDSDDFELILNKISSSKFLDVHIFDIDLEIDYRTISRISNILRKMGRKSFDIFVCTDEEPPAEWSQVFRHLTVISVREGLKRVR